MNDLALAYLLPYLDLATEIHADNGRLAGVGGRYTFTFPGQGCLLCARAIDASEAAAEFVPNQVKQAQTRRGYITDSTEPAASVMPLNSIVVSHAAMELLAWATGLRPPVLQMHYDALDGKTTKVTFERCPKCDRCHDLLGRGDLADLQQTYTRYADEHGNSDRSS